MQNKNKPENTALTLHVAPFWHWPRQSLISAEAINKFHISLVEVELETFTLKRKATATRRRGDYLWKQLKNFIRSISFKIKIQNQGCDSDDPDGPGLTN